MPLQRVLFCSSFGSTAVASLVPIAGPAQWVETGFGMPFDQEVAVSPSFPFSVTIHGSVVELRVDNKLVCRGRVKARRRWHLFRKPEVKSLYFKPFERNTPFEPFVDVSIAYQ